MIYRLGLHCLHISSTWRWAHVHTFPFKAEYVKDDERGDVKAF